MMLAMIVLNGCHPAETCEDAPGGHGGGPFISCVSSDASVRVQQVFYTPDQWQREVSSDWGCSFEIDAGVAYFVSHGKLCRSRPAVDNSDDLYVNRRECPLPPNVDTIVGPINTLNLVRGDGGVSCR